ncbi:response regulator receiver modulated diguanylate cyclase [Halospina denitrificans]|uniref:diguanylate cyclase n=1 Tax=Halospina denitrificans TaxID=332522 RepID=A0A4R7JPZ8_9GAMM|nr:diguanylate cyclase [Halospina denitrificans]TDT40180.1 response regulator receiver modulated diguanylate cyclase [Halospina denitrificans]
MTDRSQQEKLRQHFAHRVTTQARLILETWQKYLDQGEPAHGLREDLLAANEKLLKYARRFEMQDHETAARALSAALDTWGEQAPIDTHIRDAVQAAMDQLRHCTLRQSDENEETPPATFLRPPIYLAFNDTEYAQRIVRLMEFFGFRTTAFASPGDLENECARHKPETIVIDVDFGGDAEGVTGIETVERIQKNHETPVPILYMSETDGSIATRLRAVRSGGEEFFFRGLDPGQLIEKIETYSYANPIEPYRVLVIDDSRAQAKFMENVLKKAGMHSRVLTDPMEVVEALEDFSPEIIILDMYMPSCNGTEIAKVIRQQDHFHGAPIIYLSAEDDTSKQLHAMSLGGDDFLTKPIDPKHLVATLHNRGRRARSLLALMVRDNLTGLYNHTHTLHLLDTEISRAKQNGSALSYAMLDLDCFKKINDTYGHSIGDRVLRSLSLHLKQRLRKSDHVGRYGGEEFAIILPDTGLEGARTVMDEIREKFSELRQPAAGTDFTVTFSCGLAEWQGESAKELCERADNSLCSAKEGGRNQVMTAQ